MARTPTARLMDGTGPARRIIATSSATAAEIHRRTGTAPCLATVLVGEDPASVTYVRMKRARCEKAGIRSRHVSLPASVGTNGLIERITELSDDPGVHGILLQHPVGPHIDERAAFEAIAPDKDVDGVTTHSFAAMSFGLPGFVSCTPGESCACWRSTAWTPPGSTRWWWGAARSWASPWACSSSGGTPRSPTATRVPPVWPASCGRRTSWSRPSDGRASSPALTSSRVRS